MTGGAGGRAPARARDPPQAPAQVPRSERGAPPPSVLGKDPPGTRCQCRGFAWPGLMFSRHRHREVRNIQLYYLKKEPSFNAP